MRRIFTAERVATSLLLVLILNAFGGWISWSEVGQKIADEVMPKQANALAQYTPTGGSLVTGTNPPTTAATSTYANSGDWRGTLASENGYWIASSTSSGLDQQLSFDGSQLNNANKFIVVLEAKANNATLNRFYQICDWSSTTGVDNAADANCTGGGWRTLNIRKVALTTATETAFTWHIYDGYWRSSSAPNTSISTPLSNFIASGNGRILLRSYSTTNCTTCHHAIDYARVDAVVDPIYSPSGMTTTTAITVTGDYASTTNALFTGQSASDNAYVTVAGNATTTADFYFSFQNVRTASTTNTIVMRAEYSCSTTGINHRPKIYNFNSSSWEDLSTSSIACSATDATNAFAKNNVTIGNYVSNGEVRIGWRGLANGTQSIRIDMIYIMVGSTNSDSSLCEISFGTGTASNCTNTRDIDTTVGTPTTWQQTAELESNSFGHTYYYNDNDADTTADYNSSANVWVPTALDTGQRVTGIVYAMNYRSNNTTMTAQPQIKDFSGANATISGGWTNINSGTNAATTYSYQDTVTNGYFVSSPEDYVDTYNNRVNVRIRNSVSTNTTTATVRDIDFVFVAIQWVETTPARSTLNYRDVPEGGTLVTGTNPPTTAATSTYANSGDWRGTLASDNGYWIASSTSSGLDQQVFMDNYQLNNANKMVIVFEAKTNNATLSRSYQICDWSSTTAVDNAADANCTGGGWRTLNIRKVAITTLTETAFTWHIYDGYWNSTTTPNTSVSTPLSNFTRTSDGRVLLRAYSPTNCTTCHHAIDRVRVDAYIDSLYLPSGMTTTTAITVTGDYASTTNALFTGQSASDNGYVTVAGNATTTADFYFPFRNVETYTGMNTILVRAEYSCSTTGINHRPKIYNFTSSSWEDISTSSIACSATDATNTFAKNNVTITDYISNGEVRVGWRGLANGTQSIRIDMIYIILGSTNSDSSKCEISFGTGTASNCTNTRDIDTTVGTPTTWQQTAELESNSFGHTYYSQDNDFDTTADYNSSANVSMSVSVPNNGQVTARHYAFNYRSNVTTMTAQPQFKDFSGQNATISGGWTNVGASNALTTYTYTDSVTGGYFTNNVEDYVDPYNGLVNVRIRNSVSTNTTTATVRDIDFVFTSIAWVEPPGGTPSITLTMNTSTLAIGNLTPGSPVTGTSTAEVLVANLTGGYQIGLHRASSTATMTHTDATTTIPDYTAWNSSGSGNATTTGVIGAKLHFRLSTSTANFNSTWWGSGTPLYAGFATTSQTIMNCTSCNSGTTTSSVQYRVDVPVTQKTGSYSGLVTFTALTNP